MQRIAALALPLALTACGLFRVNVNGEVKTFGGTDPQDPQGQGSGEGRSSGHDEHAKGEHTKGHGSSGHAGGDERGADDLRKATKALIVDLDNALMADGSPIAADKLADLAKKRDAFASAKLADEAAYLDHLKAYYQIENAFRGDASKTGDGVAKALDSAVTTQGELSGTQKPVSFKFKVEAGKCYTMFGHLKTAGGDDDHMSDLFLDAGKDNASLQRFRVQSRTTRGAGLRRALAKSYIDGACALKTMDVTATMKLSYAGTTNGLRYVVVESAREKLPLYVALEAEPELADSCDVEGFSSMWTNPLPGAVLYGSTAPLVPYDVGTAEEMWETAWVADGAEARIMRKDFTSTPPKQLKFEKDYHFKGCPKELASAHSPDGIKVAQCWDALSRRYDPQFAAARSAKDNAVGIMAEIAADDRMTALNNAYDAEATRTCEKLDADVGKKFAAAYNKVVDFYQATPYKAPFDRAALLKSTYEGVGNIRCVDAGNYCSM